MAEALNTGILLLIVGLGTVFCVLGIVVATGQLLIRFANAFLSTTSPAEMSVQDMETSGSKIAAITGAVHAITGGKGQITHIERLKE